MPYITKSKYFSSEISLIWHIFHNDLMLLKADGSDTGKRNYIKNIISLAEGITYAMRQHVLKDMEINMTEDEKYVLNETEYELNDSGNIKTRSKKYSSTQLIKFTFKLFGRVYNRTEIINNYFSKIEFKDFQQTIKIRNRLTHPKKGDDLFVNEGEFKNVINGYAWFYSFLIECFDGIIIEERIK